MLSGFGPLPIVSVLSKKQSLILGHSKSDWDTPTELINIQKVCSDVSVPRSKLLKFEAGILPGGDSDWSRSGAGVECKSARAG